MEQIFEILPQNFFTALQSQKFFFENLFDFEEIQKFLRRKFRNLFQIFIDNLVVSGMQKNRIPIS